MTFFGLAHAANTPAVLEHAEVQGAIATIDAWIDGLRDYENIPGLSVGLVADQTLIFAKGYGYANVRRKVPADGDTIYSICSISKLFTSIGVMQMRDAGKLSLRDPVSDHLDWFALNEQHAQAGPARIQGLLTHSAGLPREVDFPYWLDTTFPFPDRETMIAQIANQQSLYPADRLFQYSNLGLTLAGEIVAKLAQQPYQQYVQERILTPLGMADTRPRYPTKLRGKQMAIGYSGLARDRKRAVVPAFDTKAVTPAAGFTSTVNDLAKFASWQFRLLDADGKAADATDKAVLDANTLREMHRVHWVDEDWKTSWGLGFSVSNAEGTTVVGHGGGCPGYITSVQLVPKYKLAAIVLTNAGDGPAYKIASNMLRTIGPALKAAQKPAPAAETDKDLSEYAGNYGGSHWGGETALRVWGDKLAIISLPSDALKDLNKLKHVADDTFMRLTAEGEERENLVFQRDEKGEVSGFLRHSQIYKRLN
jgi:CubicO group peptidase (beta-lactamase class C family)